MELPLIVCFNNTKCDVWNWSEWDDPDEWVVDEDCWEEEGDEKSRDDVLVVLEEVVESEEEVLGMAGEGVAVDVAEVDDFVDHFVLFKIVLLKNVIWICVI